MNHMDLKLYSAVISGDNVALTETEGMLCLEDQLTSTNCTVLHLASQYGKLSCVEEILGSHQSLLLELNSRGDTALHLAAREGHYDVAKALINAAKSSVLQLNHIQSRSSTVLEFLIRTANAEIDTALHEAVRYNNLSVVELLVTEDPSHPHARNKHDETPLYLASLKGYKDIITIILDKCVSPTYGGPDGKTALHAASLDHEGTECVKLLLGKRKELIKIADDYGWTAFHYMAYQDHYEIFDDLLTADKSVAYMADKKYKRLPLHIAAYRGHVNVMEKLLIYCPDCWDTVDGSGRNILHIAVERNNKILIRYIVKKGKEIKNIFIQKDKHGNTPLHLMAMLGCYVPEVLNHHQIDWEALNNENGTPLDIIHSGSKTYVGDQEKMSDTLILGNAKRHWNLGRIVKESDCENGKFLSSYIDDNSELLEYHRKIRDTHMIVAALITTAALTAGFAVPGGFDGNAGPKQGSPALLRKAAFKTFAVTDTIALLCSLSSLFIYFMSVFYHDGSKVENVTYVSVLLNISSIIAMMLAFITGMYAVLVHSLALAVAVCVISSFFFLVVFLLYNYI